MAIDDSRSLNIIASFLTLEQVFVDLLAVLLGDQHDVCLELEGEEVGVKSGENGGGVANASFREKRPARV